MIGLEVDDSVIVRQREVLEAALSTDPDTEKRLRAAVRDVLKAVRAEMSTAAQGAMISDPRDAYKAVRMTVYKTILGGNINILTGRGGGAGGSYSRPRKLDSNPHQRGGNRRPRSEETKRIDNYWGKSRGFILRFLNDGVNQDRQTKYGRRGSIAPRRWFEGNADQKMDQAAEAIAHLIDQEFNTIFANNT